MDKRNRLGGIPGGFCVGILILCGTSPPPKPPRRNPVLLFKHLHEATD